MKYTTITAIGVVAMLAALAVVTLTRAQSATNPAINPALPDLDVRDVNAWGVIKGRTNAITTTGNNALSFLDSGSIILVDASAGAVTLDLPQAGNAWDEGMTFTFIQVGGAGSTVTINPVGSTLNGSTAPYTLGPSGRTDGSVTVTYTTNYQWVLGNRVE